MGADAKTTEKSAANAKTKKTPTKATQKGAANAKGRATVKTLAPQAPTLESDIAARAEKAGIQGLAITLSALVKRQDMIDSGKSQSEMLKALVESNGLLHPARRALLGA